MTLLQVEPLTQAAFAPFGEVVEMDGSHHYPINQGFAERFNDLATVDASDGGGVTNVSLVAAKARSLPINLLLMERHPLGSQIFYPLQDRPWLVVVCGQPDDAASYKAFRATGRQGVNYAKGAWHHPLLALDEGSHFIVIDRKGPGVNLEEVDLARRTPMRLAM